MSLVNRNRPTVRQLEVNDQLVSCKKSSVSKYMKDVYYASIVQGNTDLINDALEYSEEFARLHEEHQERLRMKGQTKTLKGKDCIGYAVTWSPPEPLSSNYDLVKKKFEDFVNRKWMRGSRIWTVDQRGETMDTVHGFHVHAWIPKAPGIQQYEFAKFTMALVSYFGQPIGPTLDVKCVPDWDNRETWVNYIKYEKNDEKIEIVTTTKAYVQSIDATLVYYTGEEIESTPDDDDVEASDSASQAGSSQGSSSWISGYSGFQSLRA